MQKFTRALYLSKQNSQVIAFICPERAHNEPKYNFQPLNLISLSFQSTNLRQLKYLNAFNSKKKMATNGNKMSGKDAMPTADKLKITNCESAFGSISSIDGIPTPPLAWEWTSSMFTCSPIRVHVCSSSIHYVSKHGVCVCVFFFCRWKCIQLLVRMEASLSSIVWNELKFNFNEKSWSWFLMDFFPFCWKIWTIFPFIKQSLSLCLTLPDGCNFYLGRNSIYWKTQVRFMVVIEIIAPRNILPCSDSCSCSYMFNVPCE